MLTDHSIDTVGTFCPVPIIETGNRLKELAPGETLTIIADDPGILTDMPHWCALTGHTYLGGEEIEGVYRVYIRKKASSRNSSCG